MMDRDGYYATRLSYEPSRDKIWREVVRYLRRYVPRDAAVLELGAGYCGFINEIDCAEKHALDIRPVIEQYAADSVVTHVLSCVELETLPHKRMDVIFTSFLFEHLDFEELDRTAAGMKAVLKPGGRLIVLQPNFRYAFREYFDDYTHKRIFTHVSLADYLTAHGFIVKVVIPRFLPYSFKSRLPKSALLARIYLRLPYRPMGKNMLIVADYPGE
ncbi:class I SAM-dependent methyltransferase [bacterium]|nr:class I SAM-dependent methyltransferase [candidate division CSSED10-310 bacterium]